MYLWDCPSVPYICKKINLHTQKMSRNCGITCFSIILLQIIATTLKTVNAATITADKNQGTFEFLLLHNNDMHGRFDETDEYTNQCEVADKKLNKCYGGFARVANV